MVRTFSTDNPIHKETFWQSLGVDRRPRAPGGRRQYMFRHRRDDTHGEFVQSRGEARSRKGNGRFRLPHKVR